MANTAEKWYFTKEQLDATASRKNGYESYKELNYRQQTANFIQDMGQKLKVSQLCINTAIVYMHRFYVFHSFSNFPWHQMAAAALFLAAKVEEQPRKLEYVIKVANMCRNTKDVNIDITSERYIAQSQDLVFNENVLLQTLGFDVAIDHPHTHVVRCCHLVRASKDLAQSSYFLASNSLHLTTMCLQYKPTVVACFCIHLACIWSSWEIPLSTEKKEWFLYVDPTVTAELLQQLTSEFLSIFESCPSRLKEKVMSMGDNGMHSSSGAICNSPFDTDPKKVVHPDQKDHHPHRNHESKSGKPPGAEDQHKHRSSRPHDSSSQQQREREYREKKEREKLAQQHSLKTAPSKQSSSHGHHRPPIDPKLKQPHSRPPHRPEPRDILREASRDAPFGIATKDPNQQQQHQQPPPQPPQPHKSDNKDVPNKRDYLLKPNVAADTNNYVNYNGDKARAPSRSLDPKVPPQAKHDPVRRHTDTTKSVLKQQQQQQHHHNGNTSYHSQAPVKQESRAKEEAAPVKKPSLFSPEKSPVKARLSSPPPKLAAEFALSPLQSPPSGVAGKRARNYSTGSEPELRPVMKKIDQVEGFENLMRDSTIGINRLHQIPDIITPINDVPAKMQDEALTYSKEMKPPDIIPPLCSDAGAAPLVNGIETNPTLISNLLKEVPAVAPPAAAPTADHNHHHKSKKKNKDKHKHKDKYKSKEDKKEKKKHRDKDRHRHKEGGDAPAAVPPPSTAEPLAAEPIKIKIQKDKIQQMPQNPLKIKISKDAIKTEAASNGGGEGVAPPIHHGLKIKIPRDKISGGGGDMGRKRERERDRSDVPPPPLKISRSSSHKDAKQNGRHSYNKVSNYSSSAPPPAGYHTMGAAMYPPPVMAPPPPQNMYYYSAPQPYNMYGDGQMYNFFNGGYGYEMYHQPVPPMMPGAASHPPLPMDAPPVIPPPPPPE